MLLLSSKQGIQNEYPVFIIQSVENMLKKYQSYYIITIEIIDLKRKK
jgi:hypothetical protein